MESEYVNNTGLIDRMFYFSFIVMLINDSRLKYVVVDDFRETSSLVNVLHFIFNLYPKRAKLSMTSIRVVNQNLFMSRARRNDNWRATDTWNENLFNNFLFRA